MKKALLSICIILTMISCNSNDDNAQGGIDPVFSQPYTPLSSLDELDLGMYKYVGNKIGDRPVGIITNGAVCKDRDYLLVDGFEKGKIQNMFYTNYKRSDKDDSCVLSFKSARALESVRLTSQGVITTKVTENWKEKEKDPNDPNKVIEVDKSNVTYDGTMEIGFQAGYLRVEDHLSNYSYTPAKEKVYLYFKK